MVSSCEKIGGFINSLNLPIYIAWVLFENWDDCTMFLNFFYAKNKFVIDDLMDFREHKISQSSKSLIDFIADYKANGLKSSFEKMFYQSFSDSDISILNDAITSGKVTLEELFNNFKNNHNRSIMKYVL